jgi:hypothetical protein
VLPGSGKERGESKNSFFVSLSFVLNVSKISLPLLPVFFSLRKFSSPFIGQSYLYHLPPPPTFFFLHSSGISGKCPSFSFLFAFVRKFLSFSFFFPFFPKFLSLSFFSLFLFLFRFPYPSLLSSYFYSGGVTCFVTHLVPPS